MEEIVGKSGNEDLRRRAAELFGVDLESAEAFEAKLDKVRTIMAQGPEAVVAWQLEGDERYQDLKRELEEYIVLEDAKKELQGLISRDPNVAGAVATLEKLAKRPGMMEAILARIDDQGAVSEPELSESLAELDTGEIREIPPQN